MPDHDVKHEMQELQQFKKLPNQIVQSLNLVHLKEGEEENQVVVYGWMTKSEEPAHEL